MHATDSPPLVPLSDRPRPVTARAAPAPFPPLVEQVILFGMVAGAVLFWVAVIWSIVR